MSEQAVATVVSWVIVLLWVGVVTYFIDMVGEFMGWWKNHDDPPRPGQR